MRVNQNNNQAQNLESPSSANQAKRTDKAALAAKSRGSNAAASPDGSSRTDISSKAKEMAQAKNIASQAPEIRDERVARLKQMIAEGKYKVDADAVAEKMVKEHATTSDLG